MTKTEKLAVFSHLNGQWFPCGLLELLEQSSQTLGAQFAYGTRYIERPYAMEVDPVALSLADKACIKGKMLLPPAGLSLFGGIRDAAPDAWGRRVIEAKLKVPPHSLPESIYLLHAGSDRVGALDIRHNLQSTPNEGTDTIPSLQYLIEAADRIEDGLPVPAHLTHLFVAGTALGGARPKASVRDENRVLWLAKFSDRNSLINQPWVEYGTLQLARAVGFIVPPLQIQQVGNRTAMLIQRFDRYWDLPESPPVHAGAEALALCHPDGLRIEKRLGFISGLTLLAYPEEDGRTKAYSDLARAMRKHCHPKAINADIEDLYRRMIFNIFVTNNDDHLRNHGFLWDGKWKGWRLSPLYDVTPNTSVAQDRYLHLSIGPQGKYAHLDNALAAHASFGLSEKKAAQLIAEIWEKVREWKVYFEENGVPTEQINHIQTAFRHIDAITSTAARKKIG